ncbi:iron chaperone [Schumannella luteola]
MAEGAASVDDYLAGFPEEVRSALEEVRAAIHSAVPGGEEKIRYGMPAVLLGGRYAIHFAGWKKHIGLYPVPPLDGELEDRVAPLRSGKDSVNLPLGQPIDVDLIARITARIVELRGKK